MGICQSEEQRRNRKVESELNAASKDEVFKLLLLGTGESGKSTFFKQIICLYGPGFSREYRLNAVPSIHHQMLRTVKTMLQICERMSIAIPEELHKSRDYIKELDENESITQEVAWHMGNLWNDPTVRKSLVPTPVVPDDDNKGSSSPKASQEEEKKAPLYFYFPDSTEYLFKQLHTVSEPTYVPTNADLFRVRTPTTGILETTFVLKGAKFLLVDVGGQRNERRKWINCFDGVKAVLYIVAISEYDQQLYEEGSVNRIAESLAVFKKLASETFPKTTFMVFFNKMDLFKEKIKKVEVKNYFPDYDGPEGDADSILKYFQKQYQAAASGNPDSLERKIFYHQTCATDTKAAKKIFDVVKETVITEHLRQASLMA